MLQPEYWGLHNSTMDTTAVSDIQTLVPFILGISVANFYAISHTIVSKGGINLCISINRNASAERTHQRTFCLLVYPRASFVRRIIQSCDYCLLRQEIHIILRRRRRRIYQLTPDVSDGWTTDDLKYQWKKDDPVQITHDLHLPRFSLEKYVSDYCNIKTNTGEDTNICQRDIWSLTILLLFCP